MNSCKLWLIAAVIALGLFVPAAAQNLAALNAIEKEILELRKDERLFEQMVALAQKRIEQADSPDWVFLPEGYVRGLDGVAMPRADVELHVLFNVKLGNLTAREGAEFLVNMQTAAVTYRKQFRMQKAQYAGQLTATKKRLLDKLAERDRLAKAARGEIDGTAPIQDSSAPRVIKVCEPICGTWTLDGDKYNAVWANGARAVITYQISGNSVTFNRRDTGQVGFTAVYEGQINGNQLKGTVTWTYQGRTTSGPWSGTIENHQIKN